MNEAVENMKQEVSAIKEQANAEPNTIQEGSQDTMDGDAGGVDAVSSDGGDHDSGGDRNLSDRDRYELELALKSGWKSPENWQGSDEDFIKPREWNRNVAWQRRIDKETNRRRQLEKEMDGFHERIRNVAEVAKANAIAELEAKKREAVEDSDYARVRDLDDQIAKTNKDYDVGEPEQRTPELRPEVEDWMSQNSWFEQDQEMTDFALTYQTNQLRRLSNPENPSPEELRRALSATSSAVKKAFPDKFGLTPRANAPSLESGRPTPHKRKFGYNDLTEQEKTVLKEVERLGGMSKEEYIQAVADLREAGR